MSELIKVLKENDITKYKIFHKRISSEDLMDGMLYLELLDKVPNTIIKKRAVYFMFNNINISNNNYCKLIFDQTDQTTTPTKLSYFKYIQPSQYMKTNPVNNIYMHSFCLHPAKQNFLGYTYALDLQLVIAKTIDENFDINERSSITYAIHYE